MPNEAFVQLRRIGRSDRRAERLDRVDPLVRRELRVFNLYRVVEATTLVALVFSPLGQDLALPMVPDVVHIIALGFLFGALALLLLAEQHIGSLRRHVVAGISLDLMVATMAMAALPELARAVATLLLVNVSASALLVEARLAFLGAALASSVTLIALAAVHGEGEPKSWLEAALFGLGYFAATALCQVLSRQVTEAKELAERRELDLANLDQLNELIIRRMRTGVLVIDSANRIRRINEAAWHLLGSPSPERRELNEVAPELAHRLLRWRREHRSEVQPLSLATGQAEVVPRFVRLGADADNVIAFLDDISLLSRQAERMTLSSLGRLSSSIAHEIRNPLAAISYSAQLLSESEQIDDADQRLVEIIRNQCSRMNSMVENILQLARREPSRPERVELCSWVAGFVEEYRASHDTGQDELRAVVLDHPAYVVADPGHLHQVVWNLLQNALRYGRLPDQPGRVTLQVRQVGDLNATPVLEVLDRGPGIPAKIADHIFEPFFTTHEFGTGLGLYLARQMCEANQAVLEYHSVPGGGSCFRVRFGVLAPRSVGTPAELSSA